MQHFHMRRSISNGFSSLSLLCLLWASTGGQPAKAVDIDKTQSSILLEGQIERTSKISSPALNGQINSSEVRESETREIEWDKWRNKVHRSIWKKFCIYLAGGDALMFGNTLIKLGEAPALKFPRGMEAAYSCTINNKKRITEVRITNSSGDTRFDDLIKRSVESVNKKRVLKFPRDSRRESVTISQKLFIKPNGKYTNYAFNDVERYSVDSTHNN